MFVCLWNNQTKPNSIRPNPTHSNQAKLWTSLTEPNLLNNILCTCCHWNNWVKSINCKCNRSIISGDSYNFFCSSNNKKKILLLFLFWVPLHSPHHCSGLTLSGGDVWVVAVLSSIGNTICSYWFWQRRPRASSQSRPPDWRTADHRTLVQFVHISDVAVRTFLLLLHSPCEAAEETKLKACLLLLARWYL